MIAWHQHPLIQTAARILRQGGVVAYPTEAVWGLGCDPFNPDAVERILRLKRRPRRKGLIVIAADTAQIAPFIAHLGDDQRNILMDSWPGPNTWLVPNAGAAPDWLTGDFPSLALRVTDHPVAAALCRAYGGPLVSTSANPQGLPPARDRLNVRRYFGHRLDRVTPGEVGKRAQPSQIRDLLTGQMVRPG